MRHSSICKLSSSRKCSRNHYPKETKSFPRNFSYDLCSRQWQNLIKILFSNSQDFSFDPARSKAISFTGCSNEAFAKFQVFTSWKRLASESLLNHAGTETQKERKDGDNIEETRTSKEIKLCPVDPDAVDTVNTGTREERCSRESSGGRYTLRKSLRVIARAKGNRGPGSFYDSFSTMFEEETSMSGIKREKKRKETIGMVNA